MRMRVQMIRLGMSGYTMVMRSCMRTAQQLAKDLLATGARLIWLRPCQTGSSTDSWHHGHLTACCKPGVAEQPACEESSPA